MNSVIKDLSDFHSCVFFDINKTFYNKYDETKSHFTSQETLFIYHHLVLEVCLDVSTNKLKLWRISNCVLTQDNQHSQRGQGAHRCHHLREETKLSREGEIMLSYPETDDIDSYNSELCFKCGVYFLPQITMSKF